MELEKRILELKVEEGSHSLVLLRADSFWLDGKVSRGPPLNLLKWRSSKWLYLDSMLIEAAHD